MPKIVDHDERRGRITAALLRLAARDGLDAVSLRHVAAEAGVTAGMVQHYFGSKDAMMTEAMRTTTARYEARIAAGVARLGDAPAPRAMIGVILHSFLPTDDEEAADGRVALSFQSYAATRADAAASLNEGNLLLRGHLAQLIAATGSDDPDTTAIALLATAEGLAVHVLGSALPVADARAALDRALAAQLGG